MKPISSKSGFSLIELMLVIGIISLLVTTARPSFEILTIKARQSEAKTSLKVLITLVHSLAFDRGGVVDPCNLGGPGNCALSSADTSSATSCNVPNALGFTIPCQNARYEYFLAWAGNTDYCVVSALEIMLSPTDRRVGIPCSGAARPQDWSYSAPPWQNNIISLSNAAVACP